MKKTVHDAMRIFAVGCLCCAVLPLFATGKGSDAKGEYWEDASGVKHYYLFQLAYSGRRYSIDNNQYSRDGAASGASGIKWVSGSIFSFAREATYSVSEFQCGPVTTMYGFEFETLNGSSAPHAIQFNGSAKYTIGEYGIHFDSAQFIYFAF